MIRAQVDLDGGMGNLVVHGQLPADILWCERGIVGDQ
jgi:hypothetical protein